MALLLYMIAMVMNCIEGFLKMVNLLESGSLQIQKTMKKQLSLIKNSFYHFDMIIFYVITILFLFIL